MTKNNFFSRLIQQLVLVALLFISGFSTAQTKLADWTVSGGGFTAAPTFTNGFVHATAVSSISISHNGYSAGPFNDQSYFVHHTNTASTLNTSTAPYTQFTVNLNTSSITFDKILVKFASAGAKLQLRWSIDGYASSLGEKTDADLIVDSYLFNLSSLSAVTANTVTFRLYSYAGSSNPSNLQFSDNHSNNPENITTTYLTGAKAINIFYSAATISSTPPSITSFSPTSGAVGSTVTITGSGFNTTAANNTVFFDGVKATVTAATATSLTVTVPSGTSGFSLLNYINTSDKLSCVSKKRFSTTFGNGGFSGDFSGGVAWGPNLSFSAPTNSFSGWGYGIKTPNLFADFNNDGKPDYAHIGSSSTSISPNTSSVGSMSFGTQISLNSGGNGLEVGDIDNDGLIDLVIFNSSTAFVYRNNSTVGGTISFESPISVSIATSVNRLRLNDMNSDGLIDLIGSNGSNILYLINTTSGSSITFNSVSPVSSTAPASISDFGIVDFDNNNQLDIIALHSSGYSIKLNSTAFSSLVSSSNSADMMQVGDINNDGFIDFAINFNAYSFKFFKNSGTNTFTEVVVNMSNSSGLARAIQIAEMSGNNLPDVIGCEFNAGRTYQIGNNTSTSSAISFPNCTNMYWGGNNFNTNVAVNDVDGDGRSDLTAFMSGNYIINRNIIGIPTISSFTPTSGGVGASITISGTYFVGATDVKFNGVSATSFTVNSASSITATAPVGTTGTIQVITPGGTATSSSNFTFNPSITKSSNFTSFTTCSGTPSNAQTFTVSGNNLTASLSIAALTGYEYSTDGTTYSSSLTLTPTSGSIPSTTVYVRLTSSSTGSPSGNISLTSTNATTQTIAVTGTSTSTSLPTATTSYIVCLGDNAPTISATASSNHALRWYTVPTGGSASASAPVPDVSAAGTTTYYVSQFNSSTNCESARVAIIVTVYALPSAPSATTTINYCKGATPSALAATATSGLNLQWYTTATGGTASTTAPTPSTSTVGTTTYYVSQKANAGAYSITTGNNGNISSYNSNTGQSFQVANNVTLNTITFDDIFFYSPAPVTLKIYNGFGGTLLATANSVFNPWYYDNYNVQYSFSGQNLQLNSGQTYYMELTSSQSMYVWINSNVLSTGTAFNNGVASSGSDLGFTLASTLNVNPCESPRTTITVNVNDLPTITGVQNMTVGGGTLQLIGSGTPDPTSPWTSSNTAVATISSTGEVTSVAGGNTIITYTNASGCSITAAIRVVDCAQPFGNALAFGESTDFVQVNSSIFPSSNVTDFTIETWIKPSASDVVAGTPGGSWFGFLGGQNSLRNPSLWITNSGALHASWSQNGSNIGTPVSASTPSSLVADKWTHVALVKDGTTMRIYANGIQVNSATCSASITIPNNFYWLGKVDNQFNGALDEVRFWSTARTQSQLQNTMYTELVGNETGLLAYFNFNEGIAGGTNTSISTLTNKANNASNGTLTNFTKTGTSSNFVGSALTSFAISGDAIICANSTSQYTHPMSGGTWTISNGADASISSSGLVTTLENEAVTVSYTYSLNGCSITDSKAVSINTPAAPTATTTVNLCEGVPATALTATPSNGLILQWYTAATGGTASTTAPTPVTTSVGSTTYYVSQKANTGAFTIDNAAINSYANYVSNIGQTFTTSSNVKLTSITLKEAYFDYSNASTVLKVYNGVGGSLVATANSAYVNSYSGWLSGISFSFTNQNIILTAGQTYYFQIVSTSTMYPKYSNAYANGSGYINNSIISQDFAFKLESTIDASPCESPRTAITVNVNAVPTISGVQNMTVGGGTLQLTGSGTPDATTPWSSSNPAVATISSTGLVTAVGGGSTTLTYTVSNGCTATAVISVVDCSQPLGNVLHFDGVDDYFATASNISALNITANLTLETWIKFDQTHSDWVRLIGKGDANNRTYGLWLGTDGKLLFQINGTPTGLNFSSTTALQPGIWYHIAAVRNGSSAKILINGVEDATATTSVSPQTNTFPLTVGYGTLHTYLKGSLEDVRVWNIARSDSQIQQGMYNTIAGTESGLVAYYDFNQGIAGGNNSTITTAIDKTANALNGTLTNFGKTGATSNFIGNTIVNFAVSGASIVCANSTSQFTHPRSGGTWSISNGANATINATGLVTTLENENVTVSYTYPLNGCSVTDSKSVSINTPTAPVVTSPVNLCQGVTATALTATASNGLILQWYTTATGGTASTTAPTPSTSTVGTTTYYVSQKANAGAYSITTGNNGNLSTYTSNIGQSFQVANNVILNTITFDIIFFYSPAPVTLKIYNGFGGALIATANSVINPTGYSYNNNSQFSFSGQNLQLNAGQTYYMELTSPQNMYVGINSNVLSTGTAYFNGVAYSGVNLGFTLASTLNVNPCESPRTAITVNVNAIPTITGVQNMTVGGSTLQLSGSGTPDTTTPWSSSNTAVATISSTGEVTAVAGGTSVITYTTASGCSITTTVKVTDCAAPFGNALNFDGVNDYAVVDNLGNNANLSFSGTSNFTLESWVKRESTNGIAMIFSKYNGGVAGNYWLGIDATGKPIFSREASPWGVTATNALPVNEWHHIAATYDGAQTKIYVDGVLSNTTSAPLSINQNVSNIKVNIGAGLANNSPAYFFKGELDEIRVWNVARTATQIQQNFNTTLQGNETGLAAYYDFNQGIAGGNNTTVNAVVNAVNSTSNGTLTNVTKNGTSSNFVGSTIANFPINGAAIVCAYSSAQFTHQISGGTWSLASGAAATISNTGLITSSANETVTINYTYTMNGCSVTATKTVTIESPLISGLTLVGAGNTITLSASTTPASSNAWVSSNPSKATVSASGVVSGLATGTTIITFTNNNACTDTALITIVTGTTLAPTLTSPATNTTGATTLNIVYSLPEAPLSGSVTLTFTPVGGGTPIVWTMNNATNANFNYVVGTNPISSTVTAGVALGFTTYNVTLAYQDAFSNPASSVTNLNIQTLAPPVISFNNTSFATVVNSTLTINTINTGGSMVTYSIAPTLPTGFTFNTTTGVITGSSTVAISATTFTVTATNAAGTDTEPFSLAITADTDGDGIPDIADADVNGDEVIDNGPDTDGDGIIDQYDNDIDGDGIPNNLDNDADGDGVPNAQDVCSFIPNTAITVQPSTTSQVICPSASIGALTVTATGPGLSYQWYRNTTASTTGGTLLPGATNASYTPLNTVVGTVYYYVVVSGTCGNATSNVSGSILVTDVTLPTVITQNRTIYLNASGQATITAAQIDNGSTDNCAIATRTLSQTSFNCAHVGTNTVTLTVTDVSGNIRTANAIVTVIDSIKPTVVTQNVTVNLNASGQASITAAQINNGSSDNCGIASVTINQTAFTCAHTGPNTVTLTVTDVNGNVKTKTAIVTVVDNILPTVVTQNVIRYLNASGQAIVTANDINNGSTDNCGIGTVALSQTAFTCAHVGVNTVTLTVTDTKGNSATGQATVTIIDNTPPTANAQNINAYLNAGGAVTVTPSQVGSGSTDNCSIATMTLNNTTFNCSNLGANPVILTVVDPFNNVSTANAVITVVDSIKPLLTIPADITVNTNSGCGAFGFPIGTASATDNCSVISAITNNAPSFYPVGITNIVYSVTDGSGNTKTKIQKVTVIDNVIPIITAPAAITTTLTAGCTKSGVNLGTPVTSDNCTIASVTNNAPTAFPVGTTTVTWTVTDASGNTATATQTVTVTDAINPTISAPANLTINANASCVAFGVALGTPVTADNCTVASITNNAPAVFPIGTTIVTWKVIDASGNFATSNQTVNVVDNAAPMIFAPAAITTAITSGCTLSSIALGTPVTMDNCSVATVTNNAPTTFPIGVTTVTWTATDGAGNTATATQIVTIVDNTNPTIVAPAAVTANLTTGCTATGIALGTPVTSDNCTVASVTNNAPATYPIGTTIVTWTVTDGAGNTATTAQLVTITDNTNPTISAPANITVNTNSGCTTTGIVLGTPVTADNCTVASVTNNAPTVFPIGTTTITWVVTDGAGNATTATQLVTISDAINPTISAPANITVNTNSGCTATGIALGSPVTADNCSVVSVTNNAPTTFPIGTTIVTWIVTDGAGNTASTTQTVTVNDSQIPTITPPTNVTHYVSSGCTVNGVVIGSPVTADNCTVASVTNNAPAIFPIGTTSVTWIVTDVAGNTASATQLVTVIDTIAPVAQLMDATIALNVNGTATLNYAAVNNGSYDNCGIASVELSQSLFSCDDLGTQTVVVTLIDSYGNSTSQLIKVTVINSGIDVDLDGIDDACDDFVNTQIVQVPSGFSPNGDNINDTFIIPALDQFSSVHLQVYNKYGHEVYVSAKYNNDWNGSSSFNGMELPDDTYFYILTTDGELRQGFVYINRVK